MSIDFDPSVKQIREILETIRAAVEADLAAMRQKYVADLARAQGEYAAQRKALEIKQQEYRDSINVLGQEHARLTQAIAELKRTVHEITERMAGL